MLDVGCGPARHARLLCRPATACGPGGRLLVGGRAPRRGRLRTLVVRDEYRDRVGPWGHWLKAGLPAVLDLAHPAGWRLRYAATAGADYWAALSLDAPCPAATLGQERHSAEPRMT